MNDVGVKQIEWLTKELEINGLINTPVGKNLIQYYSSCLEMCNADVGAMEHLRVMTERVFNNLPLSPLVGGAEMIETYDQDNNLILRNARYDAVCSGINQTDLFYDDKAITFVINGVKTWIYQGDEENRSRRQIVFPYYPAGTTKIID